MIKAFDGYGEKVEEPGEVRKAVERGLRAVAGGQSALLDIRLKTGGVRSSSAAKGSSLAGLSRVDAGRVSYADIRPASLFLPRANYRRSVIDASIRER